MEEEHLKEPHWIIKSLKITIGLILIVLLLSYIIPSYLIKSNPEPKTIPNIEEVFSFEGKLENHFTSYKQAITPNKPIVRQTTAKLVSIACPNAEPVCQAKAIFRFIKKNINYVKDPINSEYLESFEEVLLTKSADCESGSIAMANMMMSIGIKTQIVLVPKHAYIRIYLPDAISTYKDKEGFINLDWTCSDCKFGELHYTYINKQKQILDLN